MVDFINFKELFDFWSFTKEEESDYFTNELGKLKYEDGVLYWVDEYIIDQTRLVENGGQYKCGVSYKKSYVKDKSNMAYYSIIISNWTPNSFHKNQKITITYESGEHTKSLTGKDLDKNLVVYESESVEYYSTIPSYLLEGTITVNIPDYMDEDTGLYYAGVSYQVTFNDLTNNIQYFDVMYIDIGEGTIPVVEPTTHNDDEGHDAEGEPQNINVVDIYIPRGTMIDSQELMLMEYDYNYPMSDVNYIYIFSRDMLYHRIANNHNNSDWEFVDEDEVNIPALFNDKNLKFSCYSVNEVGVTESNYNSKTLTITNLYEISSGGSFAFDNP